MVLEYHVPSSFHGDYMRNDDNKLEFYRELLQYLHTLSLSYSDTLIIFSIENNVYCNNLCEVERFKVSHVEADTKIIFHLMAALKEYCKCNIVVRSNFTDVILLLTSFHNFFASLNANFNICVLYG